MSIITRASAVARTANEVGELHDILLHDMRDDIDEGVRYVRQQGLDLRELVVVLADPQDWLGRQAVERFRQDDISVAFEVVYVMVVKRAALADLFDATNKELAHVLRTTAPAKQTVRCVVIACAGSSYDDLPAPPRPS